MLLDRWKQFVHSAATLQPEATLLWYFTSIAEVIVDPVGQKLFSLSWSILAIEIQFFKRFIMFLEVLRMQEKLLCLTYIGFRMVREILSVQLGIQGNTYKIFQTFWFSDSSKELFNEQKKKICNVSKNNKQINMTDCWFVSSKSIFGNIDLQMWTFDWVNTFQLRIKVEGDNAFKRAKSNTVIDKYC